MPPVEGGPTSREAQLEERVRQLEAMVERLANQVNQVNAIPRIPPLPDPYQGPRPAPLPGDTASRETGTPATLAVPSSMGGPAAPGQSMPPNPPPSPKYNSPATLDSIKANVKFGPGFEIRTEDEEYILQFHNLTQIDYRGYLQGGQNPVHDTFTIPRQWWMFSGRLGKPFGYFVSFANGFDNLTMLDVFAEIDYDPRARLRLGRMKTPFTYEFFVEPVQGLILPERSIFFNNFGQNRDVGGMLYGRLFDNHLDYAVGLWNGFRNGFIDNNDGKAVSAYLNYMPFRNSEGSIFQNLDIGGSVFAEHLANPPVPQTFRTIVPTVGNSVAGVEFLRLNNNVREQGFAGLWDAHMAYFYRGLAVIGEYAAGRQNYALTNNLDQRTSVGVQSFYVEWGWLLTGETRSGLGLVKPNSPFDPRPSKFGIGAWELTGRVEHLDIGKNVFTGGFADPNLWANRVETFSLGFNWHLTQYLKMYFMWEHAVFNDPVLFAPGRFQETSDLFLARLQVYF